MFPSKLYDYRLIVLIINVLYSRAEMKLLVFVFKILNLIVRDKLVYLVMDIKIRRKMASLRVIRLADALCGKLAASQLLESY